MKPGKNKRQIRAALDAPQLAIRPALRARLPFWLHDNMNAAEAKADGQTPALVVRELGRPVSEALVIFRLGDIKALLGD